MKKFLSIILTIILVACLAISVPACKKNNIDSNSVVNPREETIKVGIIEYPPLNYIYRNTFLGFNTELAILTLESLGYKVQFVEIKPTDDNKTVTPDDIYTALESGDIHCFWGGLTDAVLFDDTRAEFSYGFLENSLCFVKNSYASPVVKELTDLTDKKVAVGAYSGAEAFFDANLQDIAIKEQCERGQTSVLHQVNINKANYGIVDTLLALYYAEHNDDYSMVKLNVSSNPSNIPYVFSQKNYCRVVFPKQPDSKLANLKDNVNFMFEAFATTGVLQNLANKSNYRYFSEYVITDFSSQK